MDVVSYDDSHSVCVNATHCYTEGTSIERGNADSSTSAVAYS
jgi:hypothetical protein